MMEAEASTAPISSVSHDLAIRRKQFQPQQSTLQTRRQHAVCVRRAYKRYGPKKNPNVILDGLNMTVPKGTIYGLLGASGCGKTTLLSCIVGRRRLNSGEIWVLGGKPGSKGSGVPGPRIGYMPQEIALYGEFSIRETLKYFGWIAGITTKEVDEKLDFLVKFLMLPTASRLVKNLSGGQMRRVSFAAALLHTPELLILDEPTVGVDPVLRQNIWDHLVHITNNSKTTVIITTHYIEETRQAGVIGLMRGGHFLAEESPETLMRRYAAESLEDVFLKLSVIQNRGKRRRSSILQEVTGSIVVPSSAIIDPPVIDDEIGEISGEFGDNVSMSSRGGRISIAPEENIAPELPPDEDASSSWTDNFRFVKSNHMKALTWKNFLWMWRNFGVMSFIVGLPVIQIVLFCFAIGHDPKGLGVAIANFELNNSMEPCVPSTGCNLKMLSCRYLEHLEERGFNFKYFETEDDAREAVRRGKAWVALKFNSNFSDSLKDRMEYGRDADSWVVDASDVAVWQDMTNQQIAHLLIRDLHNSFFKFLDDILSSCNYSVKIGRLPVRFNDPIYGDREPNFTDFAAPGIILTIIFFLAVALTSGAMLLERNEGMLERSLVSGITGTEILFSHVITQFVVMCVQTVMVLIFTFPIFDVTIKGDLTTVTLLTLLTGVCGMCFGFVVSCACDNERSATYMALGSFLPIVMLCGIIWPIEGMHKILRVIAFVLPLTKSTESIRAILQRGWSIENPTVYNGFISTFIWIVVFLTISILLIKFKKG